MPIAQPLIPAAEYVPHRPHDTVLYREHPEHFAAMQQNAMSKPVGWDHAAPQYEALYRMAIRRRSKGT